MSELGKYRIELDCREHGREVKDIEFHSYNFADGFIWFYDDLGSLEGLVAMYRADIVRSLRRA